RDLAFLGQKELSLLRRAQHERVVDADHAAPVRRRERPPPHGLHDAALDPRVVDRRASNARRLHCACRRDDEAHHHTTFEIRTRVELLLIAEPHLVDVTLDDAPDDLTRKRSADICVPGADARHPRLTTAQTTRATAVARARSTASPMTDRAEVTEADGALARSAATAAGPSKAEPAEAEVAADLVTHQGTDRAHGVVSERDVRTVRRGRRVPGTGHGAQDADRAHVGRLLASLLPRHLRVRIVGRALDPVTIVRLLRGLLTHRAFLVAMALTGAALVVVHLLLLEPLRRLLLLCRWRLHQILDETRVLAEQVERKPHRPRRVEVEHHEKDTVDEERDAHPQRRR